MRAALDVVRRLLCAGRMMTRTISRLCSIALLGFVFASGCGGSDGGGGTPPPPPQHQDHDMAHALVADLSMAPPDFAMPPDLLPAHSCSGSISCPALYGQTYCEKAGCSYTPFHCGGFPNSCSSMFSEFSCSNQQGCTWLPSSKYCIGTARACEDLSGGCSIQSGCGYIDESCEGVPTQKCSDISDEFTCKVTKSCTWQ
jgi:hypothetical protein